MILERIYSFFSYSTDPPVFLGGLHIAVICFTLIGTIYAIRVYGKSPEKSVRILLLILWIILVINEIYRNVVFSLSLVGDRLRWNYNPGNFPLQLCSSQLYILPLVIFLKEGKVRDALICFLSTYSLFGGLAVTVYPGNTLTGVVGINLQSMIHHSIQVIVGMMLAYRSRRRMDKHYFLGGFTVFMTYFNVAMLYNLIGHKIVTKMGLGYEINMLFLSPYHKCSIPMLQDIRNQSSYPIMVLTYLIFFTIIAYMIFMAQKSLFSEEKRKNHRYVSQKFKQKQ